MNNRSIIIELVCSRDNYELHTLHSHVLHSLLSLRKIVTLFPSSQSRSFQNQTLNQTLNVLIGFPVYQFICPL